MLFSRFSTFLDELQETSKRNQMVEILSRFFHEVTSEEIDKSIYLLQGRLTPTFIPIEIGLSEKLCINAIANALEISSSVVKDWYMESGDLGMVVKEHIPVSLNMLSINDIHSTLLKISQSSGKGAITQKINILSHLLSSSGGDAAKYIIRIVLGSLRLGIGDPTILEALSFFFIGNKSLRHRLEKAYNLSSNLGLVAKVLKTEGLPGIDGFKITTGNPIRVALAERLTSSQEIVNKIGKCSVEPKYDGFRCQIHFHQQKVEMFSRNLESTTAMFPDLVKGVLEQVMAESCIFEGEAVAYNPESEEFYPFQMTAQRKRKYDIDKLSAIYPLKLLAFDLLYLNGEDISARKYSERRKLLLELVSPGKTIEVIPAITTDNPDIIEEYLNSLLEAGLEGIVAKRLDTPYTAGVRNFNWIKLKRSYKASLADSIDVVILGYYKGRGLRTRLGIGAMLVGVYDRREDKFKTIGKIGTGPTEMEWMYFRIELDKITLLHKPQRVDSDIMPDVWVDPQKVVLVQADEITRSPVHTCGKTGNEAGYALRFPRVNGLFRSDKTAEDATTVAEIKNLYQLQKKIALK